MKEETPTAPYYEDLVQDFCERYEPCTMHSTGCIDFGIIELRDFFGANQDYSTGLDPLPAYLIELSNRGYRQSHNHEHQRVIFVRERFEEAQEIID